MNSDKYDARNYDFVEDDKKSLLDAMYVLKDIRTSYGYRAYEGLNLFDKKDKKIYKKRQKRLTSWDHSLNACIDSLEQIKMVDEAREKLSNISIPKDMIKEDKNVKEFSKQIRSIRSSLYSYRENLSKQVVEEIKNMDKSDRTASKNLPTKQEKFVSFTMDKLRSVKNISSHQCNVRIHKNSVDRNNEREKQEIDKKYDTKENISERNINKIFDELEEISSSMRGLKDKELKSDVTTEMISIRRAVKPRNMSISKENLEKMRKSEKLVADVERLKSAFDTTYFHTKGSKRGKRINEKIEKLKAFTSEVIKSQGKTQSNLSNEQSKIDDKVGFAKDALETYHRAVDQSREIQDAEARARRINESIDDDIDKLRDRKDYLNKYKSVYNEKEIKEEIRDINDKIDDKKTAQVKNTEEAKIKSRKKVSLPEKYRNMKEKLKNQSNLRKAIMSSSYDMGGMQL